MPLRRPSIPPPTAREQLASRPVRSSDVVCTEIDSGARLTVPVRPSRWVTLLLRVQAGSTKSFDLDALGKFVWDQCDGHTPVRKIVRRLQQAHRISDAEARLATLAFLRTLAGKGLIVVTARRPRVAPTVGVEDVG